MAKRARHMDARIRMPPCRLRSAGAAPATTARIKKPTVITRRAVWWRAGPQQFPTVRLFLRGQCVWRRTGLLAAGRIRSDEARQEDQCCGDGKCRREIKFKFHGVSGFQMD